LLSVPRSSFYYRAKELSEEEITLLRLLDEQYLKTPFYGSRRMTVVLRQQGYPVNRNRVQRLMRGRCHDNIFIERLWRSLKYELIYWMAFENRAISF
jgi:putative transposase